MRKRYIIIACLILICSSNILSQVIGTVTNDKNLVVRRDPPFSSSTIYKLGERVCSIGQGTKVNIISKKEIFNGEVWYEVTFSFDDIKNPIGCQNSTNDIFGWVMGKSKSGKEVIKLDSEQPLEELGKDEGDNADEPPWNAFSVILVLLGTAVGVILVEIERAQSLSLNNLVTSIIGFRIVVITVINIVFIAIFLDAFMEASLSSFTTVFFKVISGNSQLGKFILSLTISILVQRFIMFAKKN